MATKSKTQLATDIAGSTFSASQQIILDDMVDSYQDIFPNVTTAQRNALSPSAGVTDYIVWNTDNNRLEYWNGSAWFAIGANISTPVVTRYDLLAADLATIYSVPFALDAAPGSGFAVIPKSLTYRFTYGTTPYDFPNSGLYVRSSSKTNSNPFHLLANTSLLNGTANKSGFISSGTGSGIDAIVENDGLVIAGNTSDPTQGDGTLTIWVTSEIIVY